MYHDFIVFIVFSCFSLFYFTVCAGERGVKMYHEFILLKCHELVCDCERGMIAFFSWACCDGEEGVVHDIVCTPGVEYLTGHHW